MCSMIYMHKRYLFVKCVCVFKQKTAYEMRISDWSSDVCSSDLPGGDHGIRVQRHALDALLDQPLRQVRMIGRPLAADADVLAGALTGVDGELDRKIVV